MSFFNIPSYFAIPPEMKTNKCHWNSIYCVYCVRSKMIERFTCFLWGCCWNSGVDCSWPSSPCHNGPAFSDRFNRFWVSGQSQWVMCMFQNWMAFCQFNHCLESKKLRSARDSDPNPGWCCSRQRWGRQRTHIAMMLGPPNHNCLYVFTIQWNKTMTIQWQ